MLAALLPALLTASAQAQDPVDPYAAVEQQAKQNDADTDLTPVAKNSDLWTLAHGAKFGETEVIEGSATTFDTDLFDVSFRNLTVGLAGGWTCPKEPQRQSGESDAAFGSRVIECRSPSGESSPRVPVLYRYTAPFDGDPRWERLDLPGGRAPGYVGAIAWIDANRALVVGGSRNYPRRESDSDGKPPTDPTRADPAGKARAWVYERKGDSITELDLSTLARGDPDRAGMRGLTAVDCYADPDPKVGEDKVELCFAGGLGQVWEWRDGGFTGHRVDAMSTRDELENANLFAYRVRDLRFAAVEPPLAIAVTAGCCDASETARSPRSLVFDGGVSPPRWFATKVIDWFGNRSAAASPDADQMLRDSYYPAHWPDSAYAVTLADPVTSTSRSVNASLVLAPGGPASAGERSSLITKSYPFRSSRSEWPGTSLTETDAVRTALSTARLVSGDGDNWRADRNRLSGTGAATGFWMKDGEPDWAVGELRSTKLDGLGARGLVVATALPPTAQDAVNEGRGFVAPALEEVAEGGYEPVDADKLHAHVRSRHFLLPSYSANSVDIVGAEEDGWAVGDHGAVLRLSTSALRAAEGRAEPKPPRLGAPRREPLSERGPYEGEVPALPATTGKVPPIGQVAVDLDEPQMTSAGSIPSIDVAGRIHEVVMSRDGSEGWAIGRDSGGATFAHYDGSSWKRCDPVGIEGVSSPDPACKAMGPLRGWRDAGGVLQRTTLDLVARVPLENDSDPSNDDELEIVAIGTGVQGKYRGPETGGAELQAVVRYRDGHWSIENPSAPNSLYRGFPSQPQHLAFTSPTDGWLAGAHSDGTTALFRFDGRAWINCRVEADRCGDSKGRLPRSGTGDQEIQGLTVAGERIYAYGLRIGAGSTTFIGTYRPIPMILYRDPGGEWTDGSESGQGGGGFDPGFEDPAPEEAGRVESLTINRRSDGRFEGWAVGSFSSGAESAQPFAGVRIPADAALMRLDPDDGNRWRLFRSPGAFEDYMLAGLEIAVGRPLARTRSGLAVSYPSQVHPDGVFVGQHRQGNWIYGLDETRGRFRQLDSARPQGQSNLHLFGPASPAGGIQAMAPDAQGGLWAAAGGHFYHYTDHPPKPVFEEAPNPFGSRGADLRAIAGGPDGSVWAATDSDRLYRYSRGLGWEEARVPGWDPGRVVTRASQATDIAVGPGGEGLAVGEGGRIAELSAAGVRLNPAAGRSCALGDPAPCGTSRDLTAVDITADGAALIAGDRLSLLWRPPHGDFRAIARPSIASSTRIEAVSYPAPERAYLATDKGIVFRGDMSAPGDWRWRIDNWADVGERLNTVDPDGEPLALRDIAVDASGHGYAVGDSGLVLERNEEHGWRRLPTDRLEDLTAVELPATGGDGVLIGGEKGLILTRVGDELEVARPGEFARGWPSPVVGFAYLPGSTEGSVDAWAGIAAAGSGDARLVRYRSDPEDRLLDPDGGGSPLADSAPGASESLSIAAFGKADCDRSESVLCPEMSVTTTTNEVITQRIVDELGALRRDGELDVAVLSGDATDAAGRPASSLSDRGSGNAQSAGPLKHRRFAELVAHRLEDADVPLLGAIGGQDLTENFACEGEGHCESTKPIANAGENLAWREAFAGRLEPWGDGEDVVGSDDGGLELVPVRGLDDGTVRTKDQPVPVDTAGVTSDKLAIGGASTHYAVEAIREGERVARIVFVDTSMRSLQASDPLQQPQESLGGQTRFLERMICTEGNTTSTGDECTRAKDQAAIVVSNTPTYSYGPGALTHTATDANVFEALLLKHDVDLVISGALGYNGLYYTLAPGIHEPCPGGEHPEGPPKGGLPSCAAGADSVTKPLEEHGISDPQKLLDEHGLAGAIPTLIAAGAGGKFGPDGQQSPDGPAGQWHGYSIARLQTDGEVVLEQRPILDWIGIDGDDHALHPRNRIEMRGYGRSPISTTTENQQVRAFHYDIANAAITHRYDLVLADPDRPWLPCDADNPDCQALHAKLSEKPGEPVPTSQLASAEEPADGSAAEPDSSSPSDSASQPHNPCAPYLCLPKRIATVDRLSGEVKAGDGKYPEAFAIAMLSVDDKVATYPLVFKPSPSFVVTPFEGPPSLPANASPAAQSPPSLPKPQIPSLTLPTPPSLPAIPPLVAATPPEPVPPAPPAPPPPAEQPSPLNLSVAPTGLTVATPTAVIQPPTPPVNPAPPGGARREARQRQAAAQKSGADSEGAEEIQGSGGDSADGRLGAEGAEMTRHESSYLRAAGVRPEPSFSAYSPPREGSPLATGALYTGGAALMAFALAAGWSRGRPTPRRRAPELPAPAYARIRSRR